MNVNNKSEVINAAQFSLGASIRRVRSSKGMNQGDFGKLFGVSQGAISNWEMGVDVPTFKYLQQLYGMTSDQALLDYLEQELSAATGVQSAVAATSPKANLRRVPVLRHPAAIGTMAATQSEEIREVLDLPTRWFSPTGEFFALNESGDSMSPIVEDGALIVVDTSKRTLKDLLHRMVAVRVTDGIATYWLREDNGIFLLSPKTISQRQPIRVLRKEGRFSLVGEVVLVIGIAAKTHSKRK